MELRVHVESPVLTTHAGESAWFRFKLSYFEMCFLMKVRLLSSALFSMKLRLLEKPIYKHFRTGGFLVANSEKTNRTVWVLRSQPTSKCHVRKNTEGGVLKFNVCWVFTAKTVQRRTVLHYVKTELHALCLNSNFRFWSKQRKMKVLKNEIKFGI